MNSVTRILLTGGSGRLGQELKAILPNAAAPAKAELDVTKPETISLSLDRHKPNVLVHAAAYTDVAGAERNRKECWTINVEGSRNVAVACQKRGLFLVHISTDYVFDGKSGMYTEDDPVGPPLNYYALSKLVSEEIVRIVPEHLVIRTSFRPREWPYPNAFTDVYTSQDYVDIIAPEIALAVQHYRDIPFHTLHIATERKSVYDLARRRAAGVTPASKNSVSVLLPDDISLDVTRWQRVREKLKKGDMDA